jgi:hypothetical protein
MNTVNGWREQILVQRLERRETCALLNSIDRTGFFDYDPTTYSQNDASFIVDGFDVRYIEVDAWRSKYVALYALGTFVREDFSWYVQKPGWPSLPTILPALRDAYLLLSTYRPQGLQIYEPERMVIWVDSRKQARNGPLWPLTSPTLAELFAQSANEQNWPGSGKAIVLEGAVASDVYEALNQSFSSAGDTFMEGNYIYQIYARPLLPYEAPPAEGESYSDIPAPEFPEPAFTISCQPSDGLIEILNP